EEVLGVVDDPPIARAQEGHALLDHLEVAVEVGAQDLADLERGALAEDGAHGGARVDERRELGVVLGGDAGAARGAEGGDLRRLPRHGPGALEELYVLRVRAGPAALDELHAERVETRRDTQLVLDRDGEALALRSVAQGRVVDVDARRLRAGLAHAA